MEWWPIIGTAVAVGFLIPTLIASLAGGYILGTFVLDRACRTTLGIRVRHWMTRHAPSKFFPEDAPDQLFVERVTLDVLKRNPQLIRELIRG